MVDMVLDIEKIFNVCLFLQLFSVIVFYFILVGKEKTKAFSCLSIQKEPWASGPTLIHGMLPT